MIHLYFEKLRYKNILSTGNVFTEIDLDKSPLTLVIGKNGSGKSTMLDALTFVLFGKPFRKINKPNLINSINDSEMLVEVEFRAQNKKFLVRRGQKPSVFQIYENGKLIDQDAKTGDYQMLLEKTILNFNYKAFTQIVILGSAAFVPFMQLPAADRRKIIEDLLDINIFSTMNTILKGKMKALLEHAKTVKTNIQTVLSNIEMQKKFVEESKKNAQDQIESKQQELQINLNYVNELTSNVVLIQQHVDSMIKSVSDEIKVKAKAKSLESYRIKIDSNLDKVNADLIFFQTNDNCPKCRQRIKNKDDHILDCNAKIEEYTEGLLRLETQQHKLEERITDIVSKKKKIADHQSELTRIQASVTQVQKYIQKLQIEIEELSKKKPISDDLMAVSKKLIEELEKLNEEKKEIIERRSYLDVATALLKDNGIKAKIIKQYLPIINKLVNKYLTQMDFFVNFNINEEFEETIKSRYRDLFSYENFSEGEKLRIDLALLFTWRAIAKIKNSMHTNLLILDEVLDGSLDNAGTEEFMKLLDTFGKESNIFIISHKGDILQDKFNEVLRFEKIKNFSEIV